MPTSDRADPGSPSQAGLHTTLPRDAALPQLREHLELERLPLGRLRLALQQLLPGLRSSQLLHRCRLAPQRTRQRPLLRLGARVLLGLLGRRGLRPAGGAGLRLPRPVHCQLPL